MNRHLVSVLCTALILSSIFVFTAPSASAFTDTWTKTFATSSGTSNYTLTISSPDVVDSRSNWTITTSLHVDYMDRYKTFLFFSSIIMTIESENGQQVKRTLQFGHYPIGEFPDRIYPGGRWGPNNVTINLSEEDLGVTPGGSTNATIYVTVNVAEFLFQPFRAEQLPQTSYETFSLDGSSVQIMSGENSTPPFLPYVIGGLVAAVIFVGLIARGRLASKKPA